MDQIQNFQLPDYETVQKEWQTRDAERRSVLNQLGYDVLDTGGAEPKIVKRPSATDSYLEQLEIRGKELDILGKQKELVGETTKLSAAAKQDLTELNTLEQLTNEIETYQQGNSLPGVGKFGSGAINQWMMKYFGTDMSGPNGQEVRNLIGQITGAIAKARGGTSFTPNEQKLLETYTPTISDSPEMILSKLSGLKKFIAMKKQSYGQGTIGETTPEFNTAQEAESAGLPAGTEIIIDGRRAVVE